MGEDFIDLVSPLTGGYQLRNLKGVVVSIDELKKLGWQISDEAVQNGILKVKQNTYLLGRWQQIGKSPDIYCDTGHNTAGIKEILQQLKQHQFEKLLTFSSLIF